MIRLILIVLFPLLVLAWLIWSLKYLWSVVFDTEHAWQLAIAKDQLANAAFNGHEDETISSRAGRAVRDKDRRNTWWACPLCWMLDKVDPDHCRKSIGT